MRFGRESGADDRRKPGKNQENQGSVAAVTSVDERLIGKNSFCMDLYFWLQALATALIVLILMFTFVGRVIGVDGLSMFPTLQDGETMLLQSIGYKPRQGDVVVLTKYFGSVHGPIVKRVIATGGQTVEIDYAAGTVRVDGEVLEEPYIKEPMQAPWFKNIAKITVPEGQIFVMGDNRNDSDDSRDVELGAIDERYVLGRVLMVLLPVDRFQVFSNQK